MLKKYSKDSPEYIGNGHYKIGGFCYMSIWSYKIKNNIVPNNNSSNRDDGKKLLDQGIKHDESIPDFGDYGTILIYPVLELDNFYNKRK